VIPPVGVTLVAEALDTGEIELRATCTAGKLRPGFQDNLIITVSTERPATDTGGKKRPSTKAQLGNLPALPFEIVP
jgi:hypothetical protein